MVETLVIDRNRSGAVRFLKTYFLILLFLIVFAALVKGLSATFAIAVFFVPFGALVALAMLPIILSKKPWLVLTEREFIYYGRWGKPLSIDWAAIQEIGFKDVKRYRAGDIRMMVLKLKEQGHFIADREILVSLEWAKVTSFEACYEAVNDYYAAAKKGTLVTIHPITPSDNAVVAGLVRQSLEDEGLARPGTVYFDPQLDDLAETKKMSYSKL